MTLKRTLFLAALAALTLGAAGAHVAAQAWAQDGPTKPESARKLSATSRVVITLGEHGGPLPRLAPLGPAETDLLGLAAQVLGVSREVLAAEQAAGKSLEEIASAHGSSKAALLDGIEAAMRSELAARLDKAVAAGELSREQADRMLAGLEIELDLDALPLEAPGARGRAALRMRLLGDGEARGEDKVFEHALPGADEDILVPALPALPGGAMEVLPLPAFEPLDAATVDAVRAALAAAVAAGKLRQDQLDAALERLDPVARPVLRLFRWEGDRDGVGDPSAGEGAASPTQRRLVEPL